MLLRLLRKNPNVEKLAMYLLLAVVRVQYCFVNFPAKERHCFGQKQVRLAEQTRGPNHHLNDNTFALASLEASKPGGAAAKQSLGKYYQKMDKSKGVKDC